MTPADKFYVERRSVPRPPAEPLPDDTLFVWLTGITAAASVVGMVVWIVSWL